MSAAAKSYVITPPAQAAIAVAGTDKSLTQKPVAHALVV
jgi:hypothetical protein